MRISDWSSDVCSSDLPQLRGIRLRRGGTGAGRFCRPRDPHHHLYLPRSYRDARRYSERDLRGTARDAAGTAVRLSGPTRQDQPVVFATITPASVQPAPPPGLTFTIQAKHGSEVMTP